MRALTLLLFLPAAAQGQSLGLSPLADQFAACAGRLAGLMEHQWMADDPATAETEARAEAMRGLTAAALAPGKETAALARETEAKLAWERLMKRADDEDGGWALARARSEIAACTGLLLE